MSINNKKINLFSLTLKELEEKIIKIGLNKSIATQIFDWIYKKYMKSFAKMNNISKLDLKKLNENFSLDIIKTDKIFKSKDDDTVKILYKLDGGYLIEMSTIEFESGYSGCITTQVGCNMGCKFCASGLNKKKRNLETFEIVQQFLYANEYLEKNNLRKLNSTSFMGIGEPLDNFENLVQAIKIMHEPKGINLGWKKFIVSTCGLADKIPLLAKEIPQCNLAVSLHAPNNTIRNKIMPVNSAFKIEVLIEAIKKYIKVVKHGVSIQYTLMDKINDSEENAKELVKLLKGIDCQVVLIEYNQIAEHSYKTSKNFSAFKKILEINKINISLRLETGRSINAACGMLRSAHEK